MVIAALSVRAESPDGGDLTYQWYYDRTRTGNPGAAPGYANLQLINNSVSEDPRFYMPTVDLLVPGKNYFFVKVINTKSTSTDELSIPAIIDMEPGERPMEPEIEEQPEDKLYFRGTDTVGPVRVSAKPVIDGGTISYQWYSNTKPEARGGERVTASGGNTASFTPDIRGAGAYYYYAVVTNTNPSVKSSVKTATATSRAVKIVMAEPGSIPAASSVNATVTVRDPRLATNRFQYVRGYGGMDTAWANFPEQKPEDMETMYNPDWGMGFNINRIMISPANTNVNVTIRDLINRHRPYYYENVKIVNKYGGYNLASPWSPPKEWKSNNSINGGGILIYAYRQQYANYLRAFAKNMYDAGAPIYAISISNEPNYTAGYDGCEWTPDEMMEFFKEVNPKPYTKGIRGYGGGKETDRVLIVNGESANTPYINVPVLRDDVTRANVDLFARHVYGETTRTLWRVQRAGGSAESPSLISAGVANNFAAVAGNNSSGVKNILLREDGTMFEVWMTEHNINSANATAYPNDSTWNYVWRFMNDVDLVMRLNNENAFVWWASKRFYSMLGDGQFGTRNGAPLPRGIGLSHYAKYSIDTHRVNIDMTGTFADGKEIGGIGLASSEINSATFNLDNTSARITAYASIRSGKDNKPVTQFVTDGPPELQSGWGEIDYISLVMWTPTTTRGAEGKNLGTIQIKMPAGFVIGGVSAHKSSSATKLFQPENVIVHPDRESAYVTLNAGQILSVKLTRRN
jgi:O-glycosyl hydrolase